jgi:predicted GNAT family acetyltransferase
MIKLLDGDEREGLRGVFETEFDSQLPPETQANIIAVIEDDELQAFATAETVIRTDMFWVSPPYRNTSKAAKLIRQLSRYLFKNVPLNCSVFIFAENENQGRLFTKLGFREIKGITVYRLDR